MQPPALDVLLATLESDDRQAAPLAAGHAQIAPQDALGPASTWGERHRQVRLPLVGEPCDVGRGPGLLEHAQRLTALRKTPERPTLVPAQLRDRAHTKRRLADHPEYALGAHEQLAQVGPRGARRLLAGVDLARGGDESQSLDKLVDPPVAGRGLAGGAGGHPAAHGRVLERLWVVAERQSLAGQPPLQFRAE